MDTICRFCLNGEENAHDPLISPCKCSGSIQYIHTNCLKQWRYYTPEIIFKSMCQLCHTEFQLPRAWPIEVIPTFHPLVQKYIINHISNIILAHNVHYMYITHYLDSIYVDDDKLNLQIKFRSRESFEFFTMLLLVFTLFYVGFYIYLWFQIKNKYLYTIRYVPRVTIYILFNAIILYLSNDCIFPCGVFYLYLLPKYIDAHIHTLHILNIQGNDM